jgi:hypothetical protein
MPQVTREMVMRRIRTLADTFLAPGTGRLAQMANVTYRTIRCVIMLADPVAHQAVAH